jgi:hypothetical protein
MSADPNSPKKQPAKKRKIVAKPVTKPAPAPETIGAPETPPPADPKPMEVHHHPEVEKKNLKDYILEGLMIFIAVTMGFFAESLREHINEVHKEHEYVVNFTQDLRTDSITINSSLKIAKSGVIALDSLMLMINEPGYQKDGAYMYYYARYATRNLSFISAERTISQLKNSGGFSLIRKEGAVDSINVYEQLIDRYKLTNGVALQEGQLLYPYISKLFNAMVFQSMINDKYEMAVPKGNPQLRVNDPELINELTYYLHQRKSTIVFEINNLKKIQAHDESMVKYLKKEYDLE